MSKNQPEKNPGPRIYFNLFLGQWGCLCASLKFNNDIKLLTIILENSFL